MALQLVRPPHTPVHTRVRAVHRIDALRRSRIPAEAGLLILATPNGYDATINAITTAVTTLNRGVTVALTGLHTATGTTITAIAKTVARINPAAAEHLTATSTTWHNNATGARLQSTLARIGGHVQAAAQDPRTRQVATTSAAIARGLLAANKAFGTNLRTWAMTRGPITHRVTQTAGNPWTLLGIVAATIGIAIGITAYQAATTPVVVTKPRRTPRTNP